MKGQYCLLKGHLWNLSFHNLESWKEMREPPNAVPYFKIGLLKPIMPYEYERDNIKYGCFGIYCFPFAFRWIKPIGEIN